MKNIFIYILLYSLFTLTNCTKKVIEIEVEQDGCKNFRIDGANYILLTDVCDNVNKTISFEVSFNYRGDSACLYLVSASPEFYDINNKIMPNVSYTKEIKKDNITINSQDAYFIYEVTFASIEEAQNFNYMIFKFNTENILESKSKEASLRINMPCSNVTDDMYKLNQDTIINISPFDNTFNIKLWDHAAEDGDRVSVYLNGTWIIENHSLLNEPGTVFSVSTSYLFSGNNDLVVFALNQGTSGPNTVSIAINNGVIKNFSPNLQTGAGIRIVF